MKSALVILTFLAISGQGMTFHIKPSMEGKFTVTTANSHELFSELMKFLHFPEPDVRKAKESKAPISIDLKVIKDDGPDYSIEILHHNNPIADEKPVIITAGKQIVTTRKDGKPYTVEMIVKDKDTAVITGTMNASGSKCALTFNFKKEGLHVAYHCSGKNGKSHDFGLDYKRN